MFQLEEGSWLGIDVGSRRDKVCMFCLVESDGQNVTVRFEKGPAQVPYPGTNSRQDLLDGSFQPPRFLKTEIEEAVFGVLRQSKLVTQWQNNRCDRKAVAVDAPAGFADEDENERATESACTQTFSTPSFATFEQRRAEKLDPYHRVNTFWKCVGLTVYRELARHVDGVDPDDMASIAAATCAFGKKGPRLRETFPSDIYKNANGRQGTLTDQGLRVLAALVADPERWLPAAGRNRPAAQNIARLREIATFLREDLALGARRLCEMNKRGGITGELWDAFACAFAICCEDHDAHHVHGMTKGQPVPARLKREGAILTVAPTPRQRP